MAHEKLSPRQKMIGMMYLVLTAMLALNVQKEVVKAFMKVDKGLTNTVNNYVQKNNLIYADFESSFAQFPQKTGPFRTKAIAVKERADELYTFIQGLKIAMIIEADGKDAKAINKATNEIDIELVEKYDENNIPSAQLVGDNEDGQGYKLMKIISEYKDFLINDILEGKAPSIAQSLTKTLSTEEGKGEDGQLEPWPNVTFQLMPLVGASALLTKIQVDVRNAETEIINFLYSQITKADIKVNKLKAVVIPKSTYVTVGSNYEASIFLSAFDTINRPVINVEGNQLDYDDLGRGIYIARASSKGPKKYNGTVTINTSEGPSEYKFDSEYFVEESNVVISPTAMKVMYKGLDNPVDISVPGYGSDKIKISKVVGGTFSSGRIKNTKGEFFQGNWLIKPTGDPGTKVQIYVTAQDPDGKQNPYGPVEFKIKKLPKPTAQFAQRSGEGTITKNSAVAQTGVFATLGEDFDFELVYNVTGFTILYNDRMGDHEAPSKGTNLTQQQKDILNSLVKGKYLTIKGITAVGPDGIPNNLSPIILRIE